MAAEVRCDDDACGWTGTEDDVDSYGECPRCFRGSLVYGVD